MPDATLHVCNNLATLHVCMCVYIRGQSLWEPHACTHAQHGTAARISLQKVCTGGKCKVCHELYVEVKRVAPSSE